MDCNPKALLAAAKCYQCLPKNVWQSAIISLLCEWANNLGPCVPPEEPLAIAATNIAPGSFNANWNAVVGATGYRLDVATDNAFTIFVAGYNNLDVGLALTSLVTGLTELTPYYYRVRAYNACGTSDNSNTITATTTAWPCGVPSATIRLSGSGDIFGTTDQDYSWDGLNGIGLSDPSYTISDSGTRWELQLVGSGLWYASSYADFPCVWVTVIGGGADPPPTGQYV